MSNNMRQEVEETIQYVIEHEAPYINALEKMWIQMDGEVLLIRDMESSHIENCCKRIKRDIGHMDGRAEEVKEKLVPVMQTKYQELKNELIRRLNNI